MAPKVLRDYSEWVLSLGFPGGNGSSVSAQRSVLLAIAAHGDEPLSMAELAELAGIGERTLFRVLIKLEAAGTICRESGPTGTGTVYYVPELETP